jgi:hypothetical protein
MNPRIAILVVLAGYTQCLHVGGADWITAPSYYTHDRAGNRVQQYTPIGPFYIFPRPDYQSSGYRHTRSSIQVGSSADHYHLVEEWGRPVRPYDEWRFPYRPYSVPYEQWGPPYAGFGYGFGAPYFGFPGWYGGVPGADGVGEPDGDRFRQGFDDRRRDSDLPYPGYRPWFDDRSPAFDDRAPFRQDPPVRQPRLRPNPIPAQPNPGP